MRVRNLRQALTERAELTPEDVNEAFEAARAAGISLGQALAQQKKISESELLSIYSELFGFEVVEEIDEDELDVGLVEGLPIGYLRKNLGVPLVGDDGIRLAVFDPLALDLVDDLRNHFRGRRTSVVLAPSKEILSAINRTYGKAEHQTDSFIEQLDLDENEALISELENVSAEDLLDETSNAPIIKLVNHVLSQAVKSRASDIHIEPYHGDLKIRFRLDGVLHNFLTLPRHLHAAVTSRIKIMAKLNIAEKRLPQDGRIEIKIGEREVDLRVSSLPTGFGERIVMRLLEKNAQLLSLEDIGMAPDHFKEFTRLLGLSSGIILVTGPTGSGKTTTLYSALSRINSPDKNILTIEDPVEYQLDGIGQMQVNTKIDLSFARGLRAMVRQDPDVILVGEIRDLETAEIAIQAALTGHLVFSTLHTNDAASAVTRLIDMGIEPFLVSSAVRAIIAQRLVRVLCPVCKEGFEPTRQELAEIGFHGGKLPERIYRHQGCEACLDTGYRGRTAIYELLRMSESIQDLMLKTSDSNRIRQLAIQEGMRTLRDDGARNVLEGKTTIDEVLRVSFV